MPVQTLSARLRAATALAAGLALALPPLPASAQLLPGALIEMPVPDIAARCLDEGIAVDRLALCARVLLLSEQGLALLNEHPDATLDASGAVLAADGSQLVPAAPELESALAGIGLAPGDAAGAERFAAVAASDGVAGLLGSNDTQTTEPDVEMDEAEAETADTEVAAVTEEEGADARAEGQTDPAGAEADDGADTSEAGAVDEATAESVIANIEAAADEPIDEEAALEEAAEAPVEAETAVAPETVESPVEENAETAQDPTEDTTPTDVAENPEMPVVEEPAGDPDAEEVAVIPEDAGTGTATVGDGVADGEVTTVDGTVADDPDTEVTAETEGADAGSDAAMEEAAEEAGTEEDASVGAGATPDAATATAEAEPEAEAETTAEAEVEAEAEAEPAAEAETVMPESEAAAEVAARPEPELTPEQERARDQAEAALSSLDTQTGSDDAAAAEPTAAAALSASDEDASADAEVTEEEVTDADVRSASEDFATQAVVTDDDRGGLSDTQKLALGALGALAVGTLLNNRARVVSNSGDRVVVQRADGDLTVLKDDDALLRRPGSTVRTERFDDGSSRTIVTREDGSRVITVRDASLRVLRRTLIAADGTEYALIDDTAPVEQVDVSQLPEYRPTASTRDGGDDALRMALAREAGVDRAFSLAQIRTIPEVRALAPAIELDAVTFASGSAAIMPDQAGALTGLAEEMKAQIRANPREVFLIEGHTDAVGDAAYNLALSDRRAESLALALNEYFGVPVENMVVQGYGERFLKVPTQASEQANRRAVARRVTDLLRVAAAN
ncbi:OmpA family protein [Jannaschia sp. W003]|uniref:OmpA family protein n=1 Tax=Jannaschia sp. W003 TaxID=2867012 RepID=UPI0021A87CDA|nr:OmpA family protein [Jannaschia sp. W003]UWQ20792.1 OmpA family protein [Jannaschia sp. W003]